jgi:hypothetical protein
MLAGRPSKFKPEMIKKIQSLIKAGLTNEQLATALEVDVATLYNWRIANKELFDAVKDSKEEADKEVVNSLWALATGRAKRKWQVLNSVTGEKEWLEEVVAPNPTSIIYWTKNRMPQEWRDRQEVEVTGEVDIGSKIDEARKRIKSRIASGIPKQ